MDNIEKQILSIQILLLTLSDIILTKNSQLSDKEIETLREKVLDDMHKLMEK